MGVLSFTDKVQTNHARSKAGVLGGQRGNERAAAFLDHILHKLSFETIFKGNKLVIRR